MMNVHVLLVFVWLRCSHSSLVHALQSSSVCLQRKDHEPYFLLLPGPGSEFEVFSEEILRELQLPSFPDQEILLLVHN